MYAYVVEESGGEFRRVDLPRPVLEKNHVLIRVRDSFRHVHTSPADALQAFIDLGASRMIPMHFGTFQLSLEGPDEPLPELFHAAQTAGLRSCMLPLEEGQTWISSAGTTQDRCGRQPAPAVAIPATQP